MSELKHTKGPWISHVIDLGDGIGGVFVSIDNEGTSRQVSRIYGITDEEREYNARLISCAPEMLEELIKLYDTVFNTQPECYWKPMKDIIERAAGMKIEEVLKCYEQQ